MNVSVFVAGDQPVTFTQVVTEVMRQLEGAYALLFKSPHYPNELVACKRGSTLILGVKVSSRSNCMPLLGYFIGCLPHNRYLTRVLFGSLLCFSHLMTDMDAGF